MVYQGVISKLQDACLGLRVTSIVCLVAAMIGSALTLASFMKLVHATFLGQRNNETMSQRVNEVSWPMWLPTVILAGICLLFGVFAFQIPLRYFILPSLPSAYGLPTTDFLGFWSQFWCPVLAMVLIIAGLILGLIAFKLSSIKLSFREDSPFVGGETAVLKESKVSGTEFYNTIREINILGKIYRLAERKYFDIYDLGQRVVFYVTGVLRYLHNGVLPTYLVWCLLGMIVMFFVLR
jgi:NADH:ubiquinone oxidoreductase subunit 5 (subunit L)/multisubunit Na+/H+ antiporter MnhA subunit